MQNHTRAEEKLFELTKNYLPNQIYREEFLTIPDQKKLPNPNGKDKTNFCNVKTIASQDSEELSSHDDTIDII